MILAGLSLVWAHVPHESVVACAVPDHLDSKSPWGMLITVHAPLIYESLDGGVTFNAVGGAVAGDFPVDLAMMDDGRWLAVGEKAWWVRHGESWTGYELPAAVESIAAVGEDIFLGGRAGIIRVDESGNVWPELNVTIDRLQRGERLTATDTTGGMWLRDAGSWQALGANGARVVSSFARDEDVFAGDADGRLSRHDGTDWSYCATPNSAEPRVIVAIDWNGMGLRVATGSGEIFHSEDDCASWSEPIQAASIQYGVSGGADSPKEAITCLRGDEDRTLSAGWAGVYVGGDPHWSAPTLMVGDYVRGLALGEGEEFPSMVVGAQTAGPALSSDGAFTFSAENHGLPAANVQAVQVDPVDSDRLYALVNHLPYTSANAGVDWELMSNSTQAGAIGVGPNGCEFWLSADAGDGYSADCGASIAPLRAATGAELSYQDHELVTIGGDSQYVLATAHPGEIWSSADPTGPYSVLWSAESDLAPILGRVVREGQPFVWASKGHILRSYDDFATVELVYNAENDRIRDFVVADDGTYLVGTYGGLVATSLDDGTTWRTAAERLKAPAGPIAARSGFAANPEAVIGTMDGVFLLSTPAAPTLARFPRWSLVDDASGYLRSSGCRESTSASAGSMDTLRSIRPGCVLRTSVIGTTIRIRALVGAPSPVAIRLDGIDVAVAGDVATNGVETVAEFDASRGWHSLEIVGMEGQEFFLDGVEATTSGVTFGGAVTEDPLDTAPNLSDLDGPLLTRPGGCGSCAAGFSGRALGWWLTALLGVLWRGRR